MTNGLSIRERVRICCERLNVPIADEAKTFGWHIVTAAVCITAAAMLAGMRRTGQMSDNEVRGMIRRFEREAFMESQPPKQSAIPVARPLYVWARVIGLLLLVFLLVACAHKRACPDHQVQVLATPSDPRMETDVVKLLALHPPKSPFPGKSVCTFMSNQEWECRPIKECEIPCYTKTKKVVDKDGTSADMCLSDPP